MKNQFALVYAAGLALAGCHQASTVIATSDTSLAKIAPTLKAACPVVQKAFGYFTEIVGPPTPAVAAAEDKAITICSNPPTDVASAFIALTDAWITIQTATKTPAK